MPKNVSKMKPANCLLDLGFNDEKNDSKNGKTRMIDRFYPFPTVPYARVAKNKGNAALVALQKVIGDFFIPLSCARAAFSLGLNALAFNRRDEILVPPFLGRCVLNTLSRNCFPSYSLSKKTRAILVLHHFGYPQNFSKIESFAEKNRLMIISSCVHSLFSKYKKKSVLDFGKIAIVSYSKMFSTYLGGGIYSRDRLFNKKIRMMIRSIPADRRRTIDDILERLDTARRFPNRGFNTQTIEMIYSILPDFPYFSNNNFFGLPDSFEGYELDKQRRLQILKLFSDRYATCLPKAENRFVVPSAIPLINKKKKMEMASRLLAQIGIEAPVLNFDFNMNMLEPDYRQALCVPCHSNISVSKANRMMKVLDHCF